MWLSASVECRSVASTYLGMQANGLHRGGVVGIGAVAEGLSAATETTERAVAVAIVHRWGLVVHYGEGGVVRIVSGSEGVREGMEEGMKEL
jgi:hypothetical protein